MGAFLDRLDAMVVKTMSPNKVVVARFNRRAGLTIEWGPRGAARVTAQQLSREITQAVTAALKGAGHGTEQARESMRAKPSAPAPKPAPELVEQRRRARARMRNLKVTGGDAERYVVVDWHGLCDVDVRVAPSALTRLEPAALRDTVNEALESVRGEYGREAAKVFTEVYRFDLLGEKWRRR